MPRRRREDFVRPDSDEDSPDEDVDSEYEESDWDDLDDDDDYNWAPEGSKQKAKAFTAQVKRAYKAPSSKRAKMVIEDRLDEDVDSEYEKLRRANIKRNALVLKVCVRCLCVHCALLILSRAISALFFLTPLTTNFRAWVLTSRILAHPQRQQSATQRRRRSTARRALAWSVQSVGAPAGSGQSPLPRRR